MSNDFLVVSTDSQILRALDASDGAVQWERRTGHQYGGSALARTDTRVIAASLDGHLCALQQDDGTVCWETMLPDLPELLPGSRVRMAASAAHIAVQYGRQVVVVDAATGVPLWQHLVSPSTVWSGYLLEVGNLHVYLAEQWFPRMPSPSTPAMSEEQRHALEVASLQASFTWITTAFAAHTGQPVWTTTEYSAIEPAWDGGSSLVERDDVAYIYGESGLHALAAETGAVRWSQADIPRFHVGSMAVSPTSITTCLGSDLGVYRRDTGALLWAKQGHRPTPPLVSGYFEEFAAATVLDGEHTICAGRLAFNPDSFHLDAYNASDATLQWTWSNEQVTSKSGWRFRGASDTLYIPSRNQVWALRVADGQQLWRYEFPEPFEAFVAITGVQS